MWQLFGPTKKNSSRGSVATVKRGVLLLGLLAGCHQVALPPIVSGVSYEQGGIVRGPTDRKELALVFTGGDFGEGAGEILDALKQRQVHASFFVTGGFLDNPAHRPNLRRMVAEGHYLGPHSDAHLLYCPWEDRSRTLVSRDEFRRDLERNIDKLAAVGMAREQIRFFLPPYEWYNPQIVEWATEMQVVLVNFTPGTRSNMDYLPNDHPRFLASQAICQSILDYEASHADGLNGFILLLHVGTSPQRLDKMHPYVAPLMDELTKRGYRFRRIDELLVFHGKLPSRDSH